MITLIGPNYTALFFFLSARIVPQKNSALFNGLSFKYREK